MMFLIDWNTDENYPSEREREREILFKVRFLLRLSRIFLGRKFHSSLEKVKKNALKHSSKPITWLLLSNTLLYWVTVSLTLEMRRKLKRLTFWILILIYIMAYYGHLLRVSPWFLTLLPAFNLLSIPNDSLVQFYSSSSCQYIAETRVWKEIFFLISFGLKCLTWNLNSGFMCSKTNTLYTTQRHIQAKFNCTIFDKKKYYP